MNIVDVIQNQLAGDTISRLSGLIGEDEFKTRTATGAAIPAILAGLGSQAASGDGAKRITSALESFDSSGLGGISGMFTTGQTGGVLERGSSMLSSLLGGGVMSSIVSAISRFTNMNAGSIQKLMGYLMPAVMGTIANQFRGKPLSPQGISSFFASQMPEITSSLPSGFSLASIPGLSGITGATRQAGETVRRAGDSAGRMVSAGGASTARWLVPMIVLAVALLLGWNLLSRRTNTTTATREAPTAPVVRETTPPPPAKDTMLTTFNPEASGMARSLSNVYSEATSTLSGITDAASAQAAVPRLTELNTQIDELQTTWNSLPAAGKSTVRSVTNQTLPAFKDAVNRVLAIPGVADILRPILDQTVAKLTNIA